MPAQPSAQVGRAPKPSLESVFGAEQSPLLRYAFGLVGRREVAEELVQDAFLRLHQHWDEVEAPRSWLFRCVRNRSFNHLRDHKRETLAASPEDSAGKSPRSSRGRENEAPDEVLGRIEAAGMTRVLLGEMSARDQELIRLKYLESLSYSEIADRTGMTVGNVGYRLHHVLRRLADLLRRAGIKGVRG